MARDVAIAWDVEPSGDGDIEPVDLEVDPDGTVGLYLYGGRELHFDPDVIDKLVALRAEAEREAA